VCSELSGRRSDALPLRVLCVDDNCDIADSEAELLRVMGFEARACYNGSAALVEAIAFLPSLCLIDLNMPGMDGDELALRLRNLLYPPVILIAVTAMSSETCSQRVQEAGFDLHLVKPVDPHTLLSVVDRMWEEWNKRSI
jgi:two-component system OmpR family response regulator